MVFSSTIFMFIFLPVVLLLYYNPFFKGREYRNIILLLTSLGFYAWGEPVFVIIMCVSIVLNWKLVLLMDACEGKKRKLYVTFLAVYDLSLLFIFKYLTFVTTNIAWLFHNDELIVKVALPIGISFFTFEMLSYVYDVYYQNYKAQQSLLKIALYISMFPQLVAGPIVRYSIVSEDIDSRVENFDDFTEGVKRFIYGLGKKVIVANNIAIVADKAFGLCKEGNLSTSMAYIGLVAYVIQIYFDFSGYSDMAIGLGRMFGFRFDENFNYPYMSQSIAEYWRRWHISLGTWFKDYLMYPVMRTQAVNNLRDWTKKKWGKSASKIVPTLVGTAVVWVLEGIWHGAEWTYVLFGIYYGTLICLYTVFRNQLKNIDEKFHLSEKKYVAVLRVMRTMLLVSIGAVLFRADNMTVAVNYYKVLLGQGIVDPSGMTGFYLWNYKYLYLIGIVGSYPVIPLIKGSKINSNVIEILETIFLIAVLLISVSYLVRGSYNPFVYFSF